MRRRLRIRWIVGLLAGSVFLWLFLRGVDWPEVRRSLLNARYEYVALSALIVLASLVVRTARWRALLLPIARVRMSSLLSVSMIGFAANALLPGKVGEVVRPAALSIKEEVPVSASLGTVVFERVLDAFVMALLFVVLMALLPEGFDSGESSAYASALRAMTACLAVGLSLVVAALVLLRLRPEAVTGRLRRLLAVLPDAVEAGADAALQRFIEGLSVLKTGKRVAAAVCLSLIQWSLRVLAIYVLTFAFAQLRLGWMGSLLVFVCQAIAVLLPQLPGYAGAFHAAVKGALVVLGVKSGVVESYAVMLWAVSILPAMFIGVGCFWKEGMRMAQFTFRAETVTGRP